MSIAEKTIERLANQLTNLGCDIKIISPEGYEYGELVVAPKKPVKQAVNVRSVVDYRSVIDNLGVGQSAIITVPDGLPMQSLRSSVSSRCAKVFGSGATTSSLTNDGKGLEVLRLE